MDKSRIIELAGIQTESHVEQIDEIWGHLARGMHKAADWVSRFDDPHGIHKANKDRMRRLAGLDNEVNRVLTPRLRGIDGQDRIEPTISDINQPSNAQPSSDSNQNQTPIADRARKERDNRRQELQNINHYVRNWATAINRTTDRREKIALAKEVVNYLADRHKYDSAQEVIKSVESILKKAGLGEMGANAVYRLRQGIHYESINFDIIGRLLSECDLSWNDIGVSVSLHENMVYVNWI